MARNLNAAETAERLGISVRTLDRMNDPGHPTPLHPVTRTAGGHRRYDEDQVERVRLGLPPGPEPAGVAS